MVSLFKPEGAQVFPLLHPEGGQQQQAERPVLRGQRPVDLDGSEAASLGDLGDLLRRLVDEDADPLDPIGHPGDHRFDLIDMNLALKDSPPGFDPGTAADSYGADDDESYVETEQY